MYDKHCPLSPWASINDALSIGKYQTHVFGLKLVYNDREAPTVLTVHTQNTPMGRFAVAACAPKSVKNEDETIANKGKISRITLYCTVLHCTVLYCNVLLLYCLCCRLTGWTCVTCAGSTVLYYIVLFYTVLYYTVLYCIVLYCTVYVAG